MRSIEELHEDELTELITLINNLHKGMKQSRHSSSVPNVGTPVHPIQFIVTNAVVNYSNYTKALLLYVIVDILYDDLTMESIPFVPRY